MSASTLNVNVGVLGHIDSGKTSLVRALSTQLSTAALDKHPQSAERGITLDLGFSAFTVPTPDHIKDGIGGHENLQFTLVDCPGHASLIRTIIGGAQIIDMMMLVVDVTKGIQTQTAECLVVGEILTQHMIVVLNKIDMLPEASREEKIEKMKKRLTLTLQGTKFAGCTMLPTAARPGGSETMAGSGGEEPPPSGMEALTQELVKRVLTKPRRPDGAFLFAVDHCFPIKGQGTVLTGTVLQGSVAVNQVVELPELKQEKKVKSMQMFKKAAQRAVQGDRVGICLTQLDAKLVERGLLAEPRTVPTIDGAIAAVDKIRFFKGVVGSKSKFHVTIGHATVMAEVFFFSKPVPPGQTPAPLSVQERVDAFTFDCDYVFQSELRAALSPPKPGAPVPDEPEEPVGAQYVLLKFESPITCPEDSLLIGSRFDTDIHSNSCRLSFHGRLAKRMDPKDLDAMSALRVYKMKSREGAIDRVSDGYNAIGKGLFKKETDMTLFTGMKVTTAEGIKGTVQGSFGKSGKYKLNFPDGIPADSTHKKIFMHFKRYIFDKNKKMVQDK
mmetsp:Transcript_25202/g.47625  ORF Transcript_25202/g.47625 Transcript_25202/m.47625 type:complete len:555 (-) Transcript_25202:120-1784(-)|eukprot:CAMPEP_0114294786 /NCGR_PEP_ID=MMETSP0059-20121206/10320_1 /TAXON_ID=36894 /ORGANISM="Pyramimonas parkeae, Strain CCMP726" /LENGTH=554 /DNA_ID=CAMNT_0001416603 /DNA_START=72 /DNA_END=1736 /DNA_ORIENTATION=-